MTNPGGVTLLTLGGTIAMSGQDAGGVVTRLGGHDLIAGLGADAPPVRVHDLQAVPTSDLSFADALDAVDAADDAVRRGADGVVLTQGTDSLEETAFLIDAVWKRDAPFVVTGAMRNPTLPSADGPANVLAAITAAAREDLARTRIAHYTTTFDDDGALLGVVADTHHGLVMATFGAGARTRCARSRPERDRRGDICGPDVTHRRRLGTDRHLRLARLRARPARPRPCSPVTPLPDVAWQTCRGEFC